ncbi:DEAD-box ATP-dependent RNA helicase 50 isoform X1 [Salvia hispanica]|uniref:DEAD-box ATP-dependent RNA helicase 50 isoform X1 n=2 Tax=Salvia hispanica TaxID=49212 RepID=UPI002009D8E2|nr:DEAD-box ATP-dependent RNA helicase 50 isoform X1 [Salvia hispanica]XP_047947972.1 DEAD-box ATP-dependent RNA helicase 50 isoform X1 [Salvia hispanica]
MPNVLEAFTVFNPSISIFSGRRRLRLVCEAAPQTSPRKAGVGGMSRSFGRLKVQRVKDLVKESYRKKIQGDDQREKSSEYPNHDELYNDPDLKEQRESMSDEEDTSEASSSSVKSIGRGASSSGFPVLAPKRWGGVEAADSYRRYRPDDLSKKELKFKASNDFFSRKSFTELGCSDIIVESLRKMQYVRPSHIQAMAFDSVIGGKSCIISDQSGSGKTLSYLIPLVQRLRQEEIEGLSKSTSQNPRVVILVPTAELASQVLNVCRSLSKVGVPFRSMVATGGFRQKTQLESLKQGIDVMIATPGRFTFLVNEGHLQLSDIKSAILDEVDILYNDEDFELALQTLVDLAPVTAQYLFVTATLPVEIYNKLVEVFPDCEVIMGPGVHRTSSRLEEFLVDCSGDERAEKNPDTAFLNKKNALLQLVGESPVTKTIVFCNKIETCRKVENALKRFDRKEIHVKVLPFHAALDQETRLANIEEFRHTPSKNMSLFLVCTDRASRGIDFAGVDHVVLFDFPRDPSEYVRRVGRTARGAGGAGKAFIFAVGKQVSLARRIIERNLKGHPLHDVPSAYEVMR